jgi:hypothetical protein
MIKAPSSLTATKSAGCFSRVEIEDSDVPAKAGRHPAGEQPHAAGAAGDIDRLAFDVGHRSLPGWTYSAATAVYQSSP